MRSSGGPKSCFCERIITRIGIGLTQVIGTGLHENAQILRGTMDQHVFSAWTSYARPVGSPASSMRPQVFPVSKEKRASFGQLLTSGFSSQFICHFEAHEGAESMPKDKVLHNALPDHSKKKPDEFFSPHLHLYFQMTQMFG